MQKSFLTKTLFFGLTANPIHCGHLITAKVAAERLGMERVCLIPSFSPPHKTPDGLLAYDQRARLIKLAAATCGDKPPFFEAFDIEHSLTASNLDGKVYTHDVVTFLKSLGYTVHWQIGADQANSLPTWHKIDELLEMCQFVVTDRPGYKINQLLPKKIKANIDKGIVEVPQINISSTEIRARIKEGKSIRYFVPDTVAKAIEEKQLYR